MPSIGDFLLNLLILYAAAVFGGEIARRLKQPTLIGELIAGIIIGPSALGLVQLSSITDTISTLGIMALLFFVGLGTKVSDLTRVALPATIITLFGVGSSFAFVYILFYFLGRTQISSIFVATATIATSVAIATRILTSEGVSNSEVRKVLVGAGTLDGILGLIVLSIAAAYARTHRFALIDLVVAVVEAVVFVGFAIFVAPRLIKGRIELLHRLAIRNALLVVSLILLLAFAVIAEYIGLSSVIGAFFAGVILATTKHGSLIRHKFLPIRDFLAPFFFVIIGAQVNVAVFMQPGVIEVGLVISLLVALGKIIGGMSAFFHVGWKKGFATGVAMIPRGGLSLITAGIGLSLGAITQRVLFEIVFMTVATIVIVPIILPYVLRFAGVSISKGETDQKVA